MKQRLHVARGLLHDPQVIFLDEPTIGLDPVGARDVRATIASLTEAGKTVLLTTHYMFEADALCDRIAVITRGEIVATGTPEDLKRRVADGIVVEVEVYGVGDETVERVRGLDGVTAVAVGAGAGRADRFGRGAHACDPRLPQRLRRRPHLAPGADARGRLRGAGVVGMRTLRFVLVSWKLQFKMIMRSPFDGIGNVIYPLFFATTAFFVFQAGSSPRTLIYASLGAAVMGMWSSVSTSAGSAMQRERWWGTLELLVAAPRHFALVLFPSTLGLATVGIYNLTATLLWGRFAFGIPLTIEHPLLFALSIVGTVLAFAGLGLLFAVSFVRFRAAWVLGNFFEYPVWLICGFLVPLALLPEWVRPIAWVLAPTWGMNAIRESALGGTPLPDLLLCLGLGTLYVVFAVLVTNRVLYDARARGSLSLT
jgi:ABC-2 type transport system permease protein